jgi:hypothetical protein
MSCSKVGWARITSLTKPVKWAHTTGRLIQSGQVPEVEVEVEERRVAVIWPARRLKADWSGLHIDSMGSKDRRTERLFTLKVEV